MEKIPEYIDPSDFEIKPVARAETIPSAWYTKPDFMNLETKAIFKKSGSLQVMFRKLQTRVIHYAELWLKTLF